MASENRNPSAAVLRDLLIFAGEADPVRSDGRDAVCRHCAINMGYEPRKEIVGVWTGKCDFCGAERPLTSLSHDWKRKGAKDGK